VIATHPHGTVYLNGLSLVHQGYTGPRGLCARCVLCFVCASPIECVADVETNSPTSTCNAADRRLLEAMALSIDDTLASLEDALRQRSMWEATLLIFASDNGGAINQQGSNKPLRGGKKGPFEGGVRVPAAVAGGWLPAQLRGTSSSTLTHLADWCARRFRERVAQPNTFTDATLAALASGAFESTRLCTLRSTRVGCVPTNGLAARSTLARVYMMADPTLCDLAQTDAADYRSGGAVAPVDGRSMWAEWMAANATHANTSRTIVIDTSLALRSQEGGLFKLSTHNMDLCSTCVQRIASSLTPRTHTHIHIHTHTHTRARAHTHTRRGEHFFD
jgi:hypothetical protein